MITVREAINLLSKGAKEIGLAYAGNGFRDFNWRDSFALEIYGDFLVDWVNAYEADKFEIVLAVKPVKRSEEEVQR